MNKCLCVMYLSTSILICCRSTIVGLYYPDCVKVTSIKKGKNKQIRFSTKRGNLVRNLNFAPPIFGYKRFMVKVSDKAKGKGKWVSKSIQDLKENKRFRSKVIHLYREAAKNYKPRLKYLHMARYFVRYMSKRLGPRELTAGYEILKGFVDFRLAWELDRFQVLTTIEACGTKERLSNIVFVYNVQLSRGVIEPLDGLLARRGGLRHVYYKVSRKCLMDLFYPGTELQHNWSVVIYFNSTSSYIYSKAISTAPQMSRCVFSITGGGQRCE